MADLAFDDVTLLETPERDDHWAGRWQLGTLVVVIGQPGSGKSTVLDEFATCSALGRTCLGADIVVPGGTLIIPLEGHGGLRRRLRASKAHHDVPLHDRLGVYYWKAPFDVTDASCIENIAHFVRTHAVVTVRIETWARMLGAAALNENDASDVAVALAALARLQELGATVVVTHHMSAQGDRERGSTSLRAAADAVVKVASEPGRNGRRIVTAEKSRDLQAFKPFRFRLLPIGQSVVPVLAADDPDEPIGAEPSLSRVDVDAELLERARAMVHSHPGLSRTKLADLMKGRRNANLAALKFVMEGGGTCSGN